MLLYLNLISHISLTFSILSFAFIIISNPNFNEFTFFILFSISCLALYLRKNKTLFFLSLFLFIIPIILAHSLFDIIFIVIFSLFVFRLLYSDLREIKYGEYVDYFKKSLPIIFIILFISLLLRYSPEKFLYIEKFVFPYILIYFIISIFLLRTLRYLEYNPLDKKIIVINLRYSIIVILSSIILSIPSIRNIIFTALSTAFYFLLNIFIVILGIAFIIVGYFLQKLIFYLILFLTSKKIIKINPQKFEPIGPKIENILKLLMGKGKTSLTFLDTLIIIGFSVLIISIAVSIIFWLLKKESTNFKKEEIYKEEKEFIFPDKNFIQKFLSRFKRERDYNIIREYYKKYLMESKKRGIEILPSNTTLDIYEKTKNIFDSEILARIREIYIFVRYNIKEPSSQLVKEFLSFYKKLVGGKK